MTKFFAHTHTHMSANICPVRLSSNVKTNLRQKQQKQKQLGLINADIRH